MEYVWAAAYAYENDIVGKLRSHVSHKREGEIQKQTLTSAVLISRVLVADITSLEDHKARKTKTEISPSLKTREYTNYSPICVAASRQPLNVFNGCWVTFESLK